jgi:hypothetical protein
MSAYQAIRIVGGIVPPSFLTRLAAGEVDSESLRPASYRLAANESLRDAGARAWAYLKPAWAAWNDMENPGAGATRDRWLVPLLRELSYGNVPSVSQGLKVDETNYPISHAWEHVPVHLLQPSVRLDGRNPGVAGAARAPQAMVQEFLNRSDEHLWSILSNGSKLRLLRDSTALAGSAYLEFDLDAIFDGELYPEFLLLFQIAHATRLEKRGGSESGPSDCWLEHWRNEAVETGTRALDKLRDGVETALEALGTGFLQHPANGWLVAALRDGSLSDRDMTRALLRLVYRMLFCFVAEDRGALLDPSASTEAKSTYASFFSTARLRRISRVRAGGPHPDLWQGQTLVFKALGGHGLPEIALPALGGLFDPDARDSLVSGQPEADLLLGAQLSNQDFLAALRALAWVEVKGGRTQAVDYRNLGAEELGSVYESLLELTPRIDTESGTYSHERAAGNDRKTSGSYYTPPALVSALLDTALDPLLDEAVAGAKGDVEAEEKLLALTVCDPACGSGGFLVAAARRIARRLAQVRSGEEEPTPDAVQHALRDVVGRCVYGVDLNDLAAELAKVSLWMEALEPGKPLGFLDARIRIGNSLLGTTPALLAKGIPDEAFKEIEGDDKQFASAIRKQNKEERSGQATLFGVSAPLQTGRLAATRNEILAPTDDVDEAREHAQRWREYERSAEYLNQKIVADAWCAAFVWPLTKDAVWPVTYEVLEGLKSNPNDPLRVDQVAEVKRLTSDYRFFHWHLEFPEVFGDPASKDVGPQGWPGGFSVMLGNPPWLRVKLQEEAYFLAKAPDIAAAKNASHRKHMIQELARTDAGLYRLYCRDLRHAEALSHFMGNSGRFPFGGVGDVNLYAVFADLMQANVSNLGRVGVILPSGLVSGFTYRRFVQEMLATKTLVCFLGMENEDRVFPEVHNMTKFGLLTLTGRKAPCEKAIFVANARQADQLLDPSRRYVLTSAEIEAINPNSLTIPAFRAARDAEITAAIHRAAPVLIRKDTASNPWDVQFLSMFHMANDSGLFVANAETNRVGGRGNALSVAAEDGRTLLPLYEGKMLWLYDPRYGTYAGQTLAQVNKGVLPHVNDFDHDDPDFRLTPRWWVSEADVAATGWWQERQWSLCFRDVGPSERTLIVAAIPRAAAGDKAPLMQSARPPTEVLGLLGVLASLVVDYRARQSSQLMKFYVMEQLAVLTPGQLGVFAVWLQSSPLDWILPRVLELTYCFEELRPLAEDCGDRGEPFRWSRERRHRIQSEVDALIFHLYGLDRDQAEWVIDSFSVLRKYEEAEVHKGGFGEFLTKRLVLEFFDLMTSAIVDAKPYVSPISPPPGQGPRHPQRTTT